METSTIKDLLKKFEAAASTIDGVECWSARELYSLFGYTQWRSFVDVIEKAKISCKSATGDVLYNFAEVRKIVQTGVGAKFVDDLLLTRYACYLVAQNADPRKEEVAFAQTYFALQTRTAELIEQRILDNERLIARGKLKEPHQTGCKNAPVRHSQEDKTITV